ncbi:MAG TPA: hypothetical protein DCG47_07285 [Spirochaetaceae bacterium]|nr:hypothetical protein [Spirochaetaceae bacterium]
MISYRRSALYALCFVMLRFAVAVSLEAQEPDAFDLDRIKRESRPPVIPTLVLWQGAQNVTALGNVRMYEDVEGGEPPFEFSFYPDSRYLKPASHTIRWREALRNPSRDMWLVFTVLNSSGHDDWLLSAYRAALRATELRIVGEDGSLRSWSGSALNALRVDPGISDAVALRLPLSASEKGSVYLRLSGAAYPWLDLSFWRYGAFVRRVASANIGFALLGSAAAALSLLVLVFSALRPYRRLGYFPYALLFFTLVAISYSLMVFGLTRIPGLWPGTLLNALSFLLTLAIACMGFFGLMRGKANAAPLKALWLLSAIGLGFGLYGSFLPPQALLDLTYRVLAVTLCLQALVSSLVLFALGSRGETAIAPSATPGKSEDERFALSAAGAYMPGLDNVVALLDELAEGFPDPEKTALTNLARAETLRILALANNALLYLRLRSGQLRLHDENFNLAALIHTCLSQARQLGTASPRIEPLDLPIIELRNDLGCMHLLFYTVMARALRGQSLSRLGIRATSDLHLIMVDIDDDGPAPFSLASGFRSHGLESLSRAPFDLAFCARLAKNLGGSLNYERRGGLNCYSLVFPRSMRWDEQPAADIPPDAAADAEAAARRRFALIDIPVLSSPSVPGTLSAKRKNSRGTILLVDGDPLSLFTLKRRLEAGGWFVEGRLSAAGLIDELDGMVCTLILANTNLPGQSGLEFCKALRRRSGRDLLPVILVIDSARPEDIEAAFAAGANDYLIRPIGGGELLARVQTHVDLASGIQRDLDQRARMAEVDKFKTLGWLTAGVAHEINTPNNSALRNVPLLKEVWAELLEPLERIYKAEGDFRIRGFSYEDLLSEVPEILNDLYMGAQHIRKIVTDLKDYARGPDPGGRAPTDINQAILYAARLLKHDIALASDAVSFELADDLPPVLADRLKLTQVMVNVLENALQALPDRSRAVLVRSRLDSSNDATGSWLKVLVRDEGVGMDERTLASAFDPFFSTKRERGGTGLGLAVAVGIVRDLGGNMEIHSSPGAGTELLIRLPAQAGASGGNA